ncbi:uncharacterized protein LOC111018276 isoform X2 [Momordica charantia]|uniref:Uncharacterized protein LOC111018276 isoform X2 n=1 Tax=Momordica charantia TaxID=3673 RepID=A0A6J1DA43_MOMCH|nr:uncharacterized protein LOC111018276 isoform X2 [Momordica charantia]
MKSKSSVEMGSLFSASFFFLFLILIHSSPHESVEYKSAIGDPGMKNPNVRVGFEAWNFCNEVGAEAAHMGSPRMADCADLRAPLASDYRDCFRLESDNKCLLQKVNESDNKLGAGEKFPSERFKPYQDPDLYAVEKERYLGSLCEVHDSSDPWYFWMIMLKNGNFDKNSTLCPENGKNVSKIVTDRTFPCFGEGCMNQPLVYHKSSRLVSLGRRMVSLTGGFYGTYELDADLSNGIGKNSYFSVTWVKNVSTATGFDGGYHYDGRGIMRKLPESPNFKVRLTLAIKSGGGSNNQFYLIDIGSCWKNNGDPCNGDTTTDVTRYSEMIINPETTSRCKPSNLQACPPYHVSAAGEKIYRNETSRFPYSAYHLYCSPGNAMHLEKPYDICDPYSNPQAQELVQILPHPEWAVHGYPKKQGDGWIGDPRTWELDVGALSNRLYFYQDPGTKPARRVWKSINVGAEIYISEGGVTAEWSVSDFDVLVPQDPRDANCCSY